MAIVQQPQNVKPISKEHEYLLKYKKDTQIKKIHANLRKIKQLFEDVTKIENLKMEYIILEDNIKEFKLMLIK